MFKVHYSDVLLGGAAHCLFYVLVYYNVGSYIIIYSEFYPCICIIYVILQGVCMYIDAVDI